MSEQYSPSQRPVLTAGIPAMTCSKMSRTTSLACLPVLGVIVLPPPVTSQAARERCAVRDHVT